MRTRVAATVVALGVGVSACGGGSGNGGSPAATPTSPTAAAAKSSPAPIEATWAKITDPSGARFTFPKTVQPALSGTGKDKTRTYIAEGGGGTVATIVIIPTAVELNVQNFVKQYPAKLASDGATNVKAGTVSPLTLQGAKGFQTQLTYDSAPPGPSHVYETRAALQFPTYFVVISTIVLDEKAIAPAALARAKAVNAALLRGFSASAK